LDKGSRIVEILKQKQYSPMPVEKQIAILYLGTQGLLQNIPVAKIKQFEEDFHELMEAKHKDALADLRKGNLSDTAIEAIKQAGKEVEIKYVKK